MKAIKELTRLVNKNKIKQIDVLDTTKWNTERSLPQTYQLYEGLLNEQWSSEADAKKYFFPDTPYQDIYFGRLKNKLFQKLINTVFFIDTTRPQYSDVQKAYYACYRDFAAMKIIIGKGARTAGVELGEKLIKRAIKYEFPSLVVETARSLRVHFGSIVGDLKKFEQYNKISKSYSKILEAEALAEEYYVILASFYTKSSAYKEDVINISASFSEELSRLQIPIRTRRFDFLSSYVHILRYEIIPDYPNMLRTCENAIQLFSENHQKAQDTILYTFMLKKLVCLLLLGRYEEGKATVKSCQKMEGLSGINWFSLHYYYIILLFHADNWRKAAEVFQDITQTPGFNNLPNNILEQWKIHEAYVAFFQINESKKSNNKKDKTTFKVGKFLNEVPSYSKDKRGSNISIILIQILFFLQKKEYTKIIDRVESLKMYCHRYLRKDDTFRSNCFVKMIATLPSANFNKIATIRKTKKLHEKLLASPLSSARQTAELEVVPYEMLWEEVLQLLE